MKACNGACLASTRASHLQHRQRITAPGAQQGVACDILREPGGLKVMALPGTVILRVVTDQGSNAKKAA